MGQMSKAKLALREEVARIDAIKRRAAPPVGCSDAVPVAPAAAPSVPFRHVEAVQTGSGPRLRSTTVAGRHAARRCGPLEVMEHLAARRGGKAPLRFEVCQHAAAVEYVALAEFCAASGVKLSSLEGGGGGGDVMGRMDRAIHALGRFRAMRHAIGDEVVLGGRGSGAHADRGRRVIRAVSVVDGVLLQGKTIAGLLASHGWSRQTRYTKALQEALSGALMRIDGL